MEVAQCEENHLELSVFAAGVEHLLIEIVQCLVQIRQHAWEFQGHSSITALAFGTCMRFIGDLD